MRPTAHKHSVTASLVLGSQPSKIGWLFAHRGKRVDQVERFATVSERPQLSITYSDHREQRPVAGR